MLHHLDYPKHQVCPGCLGYLHYNVGIPVWVTYRGQRVRRQVHDEKRLERAQERVDVVLDIGGAEEAACRMQNQFA